MARAFKTASEPRSSSLGGKDQRNRARRSISALCCRASHTQATCSGEKVKFLFPDSEFVAPGDDDPDGEGDETSPSPLELPAAPPESAPAAPWFESDPPWEVSSVNVEVLDGHSPPLEPSVLPLQLAEFPVPPPPLFNSPFNVVAIVIFRVSVRF